MPYCRFASIKHLTHEVLLASEGFPVEQCGIVARHLKTPRRSAGGRSHEQLDLVDLRARNTGVPHEKERRRRDRVEDLLFVVRSQLSAERVRSRRRDLSLEDAHVLVSALEFVEDLGAELRTGR